eukprot:scaffold6333_cov105-Skeletonema_dohrnii-CCMP3373.AAC.1
MPHAVESLFLFALCTETESPSATHARTHDVPIPIQICDQSIVWDLVRYTERMSTPLQRVWNHAEESGR